MKKYLLTAILLVLALALVACGGTGDDTTLPDDTEPPVVECNHNYVEETVPATCTTVGKRSEVCSLCGDIKSTTEIPLADHTASALECEKDTVCTVCGTVLAAKTGHIFTSTETVTAATCTTAGKEKGTCVTCGTTIENDIPALGHTAGSDLKLVDGNFQTTCTVCSQAVTLKLEAPALSLDFESDDLAAAAVNEIGLEIYNPGDWGIEEVNGSKAYKQKEGGGPVYINIADPEKLQALGTFVISFDYTVNNNGTGFGSSFSLLNNFYDAAGTSAGSTGWGWFFKVTTTDVSKIATVNQAGLINDDNSVELEMGKTYKIQIVVSPSAKGGYVFVDGKYIGNGNQATTISSLAANNACFRFCDGPDFGHTFDNFTISALK